MHAANASNIISESDYGIHTNLKNRKIHFMNKSKGDRVQNTKGRNKNASGLILYFIQHADKSNMFTFMFCIACIMKRTI